MRVLIVAATVVAIVTIGITIWFQMAAPDPAPSVGSPIAPKQYDTTGGQQMRPRWNSGGPSDDAPGN